MIKIKRMEWSDEGRFIEPLDNIYGCFKGGSARPKPTPIPQVDPATLQAQFEPAEEDEATRNKKMKRKGKKSLIVPRTSGQAGVQKGTKKGSGLQVGAK